MAKKNGNGFWIKFLAGIGIVLLGFAVGYGTLNQKVAGNCKTIEKHEEKIDTCEKAVIEQRSDIKHIKEAVDRIEEKL